MEKIESVEEKDISSFGHTYDDTDFLNSSEPSLIDGKVKLPKTEWLMQVEENNDLNINLKSFDKTNSNIRDKPNNNSDKMELVYLQPTDAKVDQSSLFEAGLNSMMYDQNTFADLEVHNLFDEKCEKSQSDSEKSNSFHSINDFEEILDAEEQKIKNEYPVLERHLDSGSVNNEDSCNVSKFLCSANSAASWEDWQPSCEIDKIEIQNAFREAVSRRSEPLGSLSAIDGKRPSWGKEIISPPVKREPTPLVSQKKIQLFDDNNIENNCSKSLSFDKHEFLERNSVCVSDSASRKDSSDSKITSATSVWSNQLDSLNYLESGNELITDTNDLINCEDDIKKLVSFLVKSRTDKKQPLSIQEIRTKAIRDQIKIALQDNSNHSGEECVTSNWSSPRPSTIGVQKNNGEDYQKTLMEESLNMRNNKNIKATTSTPNTKKVPIPSTRESIISRISAVPNNESCKRFHDDTIESSKLTVGALFDSHEKYSIGLLPPEDSFFNPSPDTPFAPQWQSTPAIRTSNTNAAVGASTPTSSLGSVSIDVIPRKIFIERLICVGTTFDTTISIANPSSKLLSIDMDATTYLNGERFTDKNNSIFMFRNNITVEPGCNQDVRVVFAPLLPGKYECEININASSVAYRRHSLSTTSSVHIKGEAECPQIDITPSTEIDFGVLDWQSSENRYLRLVNKSRSELNVKLTINNTSNWFFFAPVQNERDCINRPITDAYLLPAYHDDSTETKEHKSNVLHVFIFCSAPSFRQDYGIDPLNINASLTVEVDIAGYNMKMSTLPLKANVGTALFCLSTKLLLFVIANDKDEKINQVKKRFSIKNTGTIPLQFLLTSQKEYFTIHPCNFFIEPAQELDIVVKFTANEYLEENVEIKNSLTLQRKPGNNLFEMETLAIVKPKRTLVGDKQALMFGRINKDSIKKMKFRILSKINSNVKLSLLNETSLVFKLDCDSEISLLANEEREIILSCFQSKNNNFHIYKDTLAIKETWFSDYHIPLFAYSGGAEIISPNIKFTDDKRFAVLTSENIDSNNNLHWNLKLKNVGSMTAFIKLIAYGDLTCEKKLDNFNFNGISKICLQPGFEKTLKFHCSYNQNFTYANLSVACFLNIFYGDEFQRRLYKKSENVKFDNVLPYNDFNTEFVNENECFDDISIPPEMQIDKTIFKEDLQCVKILLIIGSKNIHQFKPLIARNFDDTCLSMSMRKDDLTFNSYKPPAFWQDTDDNSWILEPKSIIISPGERYDDSNQNVVKLINKTMKHLRFELEWPAHTLRLAPFRGQVQPNSSVNLNVWVVDNVESDFFPWSGNVHVVCNEQSKKFSVLVKEISSRPPLRLKPDNMTRELSYNQKLDFPKIIDFGLIKSTKLTESVSFDIKNVTSENIDWHIKQVTPAFIRTANNHENHKVIYSIFQFNKLSGNVRAKSTDQITVQFRPNDCGSFTQIWNLSCANNTNISRITLKGEAAEIFSATAPAVLSSVSTNFSDKIFLIPKLEVSPVIFNFNVNLNEVDRKSEIKKLDFRNRCHKTVQVTFEKPEEPFIMNPNDVCIRNGHFLRIPITFHPKKVGEYSSFIYCYCENGKVTIKLNGICN